MGGIPLFHPLRRLVLNFLPLFIYLPGRFQIQILCSLVEFTGALSCLQLTFLSGVARAASEPQLTGSLDP
jgi:hypothetical protein